jgi:valyl-tRNA synthetase
MRSLADKALAEVIDGRVKIHPEERFLNTYKYWLENVKDWCISRQLWWGQRIPAWYDKDGNCFVAETEEEAKKLAANSELVQDEDVLDTWFSSWLWPMEVFKGITKPGNEEINYYYPTSVLVTGQDIIFFWVARMIMAGMEYQHERPFEHVYFTGMVRDKQGRKMSKSLGNSPDLLQLIDKYGADAVRFGIMISAPAGNDLLFDDLSPEQGKFFNNKIWNALKLVKLWESRLTTNSNSEGLTDPDVSGFASSEAENQPLTKLFAVEWFENRLAQARLDVEKQLTEFRLSEALKTIYSLIWDDFCSWYLEWIKPGYEESMDLRVYNRTVEFFGSLMQLLHPFMPFITEEINELLAPGSQHLSVKQFPSISNPDMSILSQGELLKEVITGLRDARNKQRLKPRDEVKLYVLSDRQAIYERIEPILLRQINASSIAFTGETLGNTISVVIGKDKFSFKRQRKSIPPINGQNWRRNWNILKDFWYPLRRS